MDNKSVQEMNLRPAQSEVRSGQKKAILLKICLFIPFILLLGAYIYMAFFYQRLWLFDTIVHENGKYTLLETILYFRHFSWEMPGKAVYCFFVVGAFFYYGNARSQRYGTCKVNVPSGGAAISALIAFGIVAIAVFITIRKYGFEETFIGLLQHRTSELRSPMVGSHWRNHFLSNIVLFSASVFFILVYRLKFCGGYWVKRRLSILFPIATGVFVAVTVYFGFTKDPFETASYLGHQLREIVGSDLPVTMLLAFSVLIYLESKYDDGVKAVTFDKQKERQKGKLLIGWLLPVFLIAGFLIERVLNLDISGEIATLGNTRNWSVLTIFAWHFYEHSLDYIFVVSLVSFLYLIILKMEFRKAVDEKKSFTNN